MQGVYCLESGYVLFVAMQIMLQCVRGGVACGQNVARYMERAELLYARQTAGKIT